MDLDWKENRGVHPVETLMGNDTGYVVHFTECKGETGEQAQLAINACIDKASGLLDKNINADSMYLLFEWDVVYSMLTIVVTDELKENDSRHVVKCSLATLNKKMHVAGGGHDSERASQANNVADNVKFWIKDYLTTCSLFLNYSLVAAFHYESRDTCRLL